MAYGNKCPKCGRSFGSMTHRVKCLGKSRGAERAKAREAAARRRAGMVRGSRRGWGGLGASPLGTAGTVTIMASESFYADRAQRAEVQEAQP